MKTAEELLKEIPSQDYFSRLNAKTYTQCRVIEAMKAYAKLMVQKDREAIKKNAQIIQSDTEYNSVTGRRDPVFCLDEQSIDVIPIDLE